MIWWWHILFCLGSLPVHPESRVSNTSVEWYNRGEHCYLSFFFFLFSFFINIFLVVITLLNGFQSNACIGSFEKKKYILGSKYFAFRVFLILQLVSVIQHYNGFSQMLALHLYLVLFGPIYPRFPFKLSFLFLCLSLMHSLFV